MFFINNIEFKRGKDKKKRKSRLKSIGLGLAGLGLGLGGAYLIRKDVKQSQKKLQEIINNNAKATQKFNDDMEEINTKIREYNANLKKPTVNKPIKNISDLDDFMLGKKSKPKFTTSTGYESNVIGTRKQRGLTSKNTKAKKYKPKNGLNIFQDTNLIRRKLNNPNSTWDFS